MSWLSKFGVGFTQGVAQGLPGALQERTRKKERQEALNLRKTEREEDINLQGKRQRRSEVLDQIRLASTRSELEQLAESISGDETLKDLIPSIEAKASGVVQGELKEERDLQRTRGNQLSDIKMAADLADERDTRNLMERETLNEQRKQENLDLAELKEEQKTKREADKAELARKLAAKSTIEKILISSPEDIPAADARAMGEAEGLTEKQILYLEKLTGLPKTTREAYAAQARGVEAWDNAVRLSVNELTGEVNWAMARQIYDETLKVYRDMGVAVGGKANNIMQLADAVPALNQQVMAAVDAMGEDQQGDKSTLNRLVVQEARKLVEGAGISADKVDSWAIYLSSQIITLAEAKQAMRGGPAPIAAPAAAPGSDRTRVNAGATRVPPPPPKADSTSIGSSGLPSLHQQRKDKLDRIIKGRSSTTTGRKPPPIPAGMDPTTGRMG